jgi:hypothetical protein
MAVPCPNQMDRVPPLWGRTPTCQTAPLTRPVGLMSRTPGRTPNSPVRYTSMLVAENMFFGARHASRRP